ncbi:MAG: chloride channel protein, partial [Chloroflexi bacterium]|nr:chloride channel protein [Chloroflexota bacterium]
EGVRPGIVIPDYALESAIEIGLYALLGLAAAFVGVFWLRLLYLVEDIFEVLPTSSYTKPVVAMFALGALGFWHDEVFGTGFAAIEQATLGEIATGTLAILLVIKPLATSLTLGGGASGGVFAPSLFIGAMLGGLLGAAFVELAPDQVGPSGAYAVVGMAAVFAAAARAPITSLFIVFELTRDYSLILPLMTAVAIATAVAQIITRDTIYSIKLARRGVDVTEEPAAAVVADLTVAETMSTNVPLVTEDTDLQELTLAMSRSRGTVLAVIDEEGRFRGLVSATDLTAALERTDQNLVASDISVASPQRVYPDDQLGHVVELMAEGDLRQLPVVARWDERRLLGMISQRDVLRQVARRGPRRAGTTRRAEPVRRLIGAVQIEFTVEQESGLVGRELREIQLPEGSIVTIIHRQGTVVIPRGQVTVEAGDQLTILAEPVAEAAVRRVLAEVVQAADAGTTIESSQPPAPDSD